MKKLWSILLALSMVFALAACGNQGTAGGGAPSATPAPSGQQPESPDAPDTAAPETLTITTRNGAGETVEIEFPYDPAKVAVMDLAALDILDSIGRTDRITGVSKGSSIDYLQAYVTDDSLLNLGTVKEADLEAVMECEPEVIFIGGRLSSYYDELVKIAPVYMVYTDSEAGVVASTAMNTKNIASLFGLEDQVDALLSAYDARIQALQAAAEGRTAIVGMVNAGGFGLLGNDGRCSIISRELGFENIGVDANMSTSTHGNEASFEFVLNADPDYIFVMDRDAAIGTEGAQLAAEVMDNELVNKTAAAQSGHVVVLDHSNVWYTAEGGITALGIMLSDLESALW